VARRARGLNVVRASPLSLAWIATLCACSGARNADAGDASADAHWPCPAEWVAYARGGCGPAIMLCVPDGGATRGACNGIDITQAHSIALPDGGTTSSLYRLPDGGIAGPWHEPGDPEGPPAADWAPDAGIPTCPTGWRRRGDETCDPDLRTDCPAGSEPLPGGRCTRTAALDCPSSEYADVSAEVGSALVVHVRAGAAGAVADGSEARPYESVVRGIAAAGAGGWVLVAAGRYDEAVMVGASVNVVGTCASRVTLTAGALAAVVNASGSTARLVLRGATVTGAANGVWASAGARVQASAVRVHAATGYAVRADGAGSELILEDSAVVDTVALASGVGNALLAANGAHIEARRVAATGNTEAGVQASGRGSQINVEDSVVRGTGSRPDGRAGFGLIARLGATVRATRVLVVANHGVGAFAVTADSRMELTDAIVRGTLADGAGQGGHGLGAQDGATLVAVRVLSEGNRDGNALATGADGRLELLDSVVRGALPGAGGLGGYGLSSQTGATLLATRVLVVDNRDVGATAYGADSRLDLTDTVVRGTRSRGDGQSGSGVTSQSGATVTATRVLIVDNRAVGASAINDGARLDLRDSVVRGTLVTIDGLQGTGLNAEADATLVATRVLVDANHDAGAIATGVGSRMELFDSVVRRTLAVGDGGHGYGLIAQTGATLLATRVLVADNREAGVVATGPGTSIVFTDGAVRAMFARPGGSAGFGMSAQDHATVAAMRAYVVETRDIALFAVLSGEMRMADVIVSTVAPESTATFGGGLVAMDGAYVDAVRLSVTGVNGFALAAIPRSGATDTARLSARDVFVRTVRSSNVSIGRPDAPPVAYGLVSGNGCALDVARAVIDDGGWGLFRSRGTLTLRDAVIARQLNAAGASNGPTDGAPFTLTNVLRTDNARDDIQSDVELIDIELPRPTMICLSPPCM